MAKRYRLRNVDPTAVALTGNPAFKESFWLLLKNNMAVKYDSISFSGKPLHPWSHVENIGEDDILLLVTSVLLAPGDPKPDGGTYDAEEIAGLESLWAGRYSATDRDGGYGSAHYIREGDKANFDTAVVAFGLAGDKELSLQGAGDAVVPPGAWFMQLVIADDDGTASRTIGNKKVLNGLAVKGAAILLKQDADEWPDVADNPPDGFYEVATNDDDQISPEQVGRALAEVAIQAAAEAMNPEIDPATAGRELADALVPVEPDDEVDPADVGKFMAEIAVKTVEDIFTD